MPDTMTSSGSLSLAENQGNHPPAPMTLAQKMRALEALAHQGRESEVYSIMAIMLQERPWPSWLKRVCEDIDGPRVSKDRPVNQEDAR